MRSSVASILVLTAIGGGVAHAVTPHVAFVTSTICPGNFAMCPHAGANTGVAAADAECANRAAAAGLAGTFVAWVSTSAPLPAATDAYCHLHDLTGSRNGSPGNCNVGSLPSGAGPWRRTDAEGSPFAASSPLLVYPDLVVYNPPRLNESGAVVNGLVWTGTDSSGAADGNDCSEWGSTSPVINATVGSTSATGWGWNNNGSAPCSESHHLLCFQTGIGAPLPARAGGARLAFATSAHRSGDFHSWPEAGGQSGIAAADAICRQVAVDATLSYASSFRAWISTSSTNAISRLVNDGEWMRLDRVRVASSKAELTSGLLTSPINLSEQGIYLGNQGAWTGTKSDGTVSTTTCSDWTTPAGTGRAGSVQDSASWTQSFGGDCSVGETLYCLQDLPFDFYDGFEWGDTTGWPAAQAAP